MGTSSESVWLCQHCGRPIADNPSKWIGGTPFHAECCRSPYAPSTYQPLVDLPGNPKLAQLMQQAIAQFNAMTPEQQEEHLAAQRKSWVRGEMGFGDEGTRTMKPKEGT